MAYRTSLRLPAKKATGPHPPAVMLCLSVMRGSMYKQPAPDRRFKLTRPQLGPLKREKENIVPDPLPDPLFLKVVNAIRCVVGKKKNIAQAILILSRIIKNRQ